MTLLEKVIHQVEQKIEKKKHNSNGNAPFGQGYVSLQYLPTSLSLPKYEVLTKLQGGPPQHQQAYMGGQQGGMMSGGHHQGQHQGVGQHQAGGYGGPGGFGGQQQGEWGFGGQKGEFDTNNGGGFGG